MEQEIIKHTPNVELHLHKAIKLFGITKNINEAGFLLVNGKFLNLSNYDIRGDHNDIAEIFEDEPLIAYYFSLKEKEILD